MNRQILQLINRTKFTNNLFKQIRQLLKRNKKNTVTIADVVHNILPIQIWILNFNNK